MIIQLRDLKTRNIIGLFGEFTSLIWTERFQGNGDFELTTPLSERAVDLIQVKRLIKIPESDNLMLITNVEYGEDELKATGYDLKILLDNRIIYEWRNTETSVKLVEFMKGLVESSLINSKYEDRNVDNLSVTFNVDEEIDDISIVTDINRGNSLGDSLRSLCKEFNLGIDVEFDIYSKKIQFLVYSGGDKKNLIFSSGNHNFKRSRYVKSYDNLVSSMLVAGEGEGTSRKMVTVSRVVKIKNEDETITETVFNGIERVEGFLDARDIQKKSGESTNNYKERLKNRAILKMSDLNVEHLVDGEIRDTASIKIGVDYGNGDVVTVKDKYFKATVRIIEVIRSWSSSGYEIYPTFEVVDVTTSEVMEEFNMT